MKLEIVSGSPNADELAAIIAALNSVLAQKAPQQPVLSHWLLAGRDYSPLEQLANWRTQGLAEPDV